MLTATTQVQQSFMMSKGWIKTGQHFLFWTIAYLFFILFLGVQIAIITRPLFLLPCSFH